MKKTTFLKTMLLLCALIVGSLNSVWADDTYARITKTDDLEVDGEYIIVSETNKVAMGVVNSDKGTGVSVTIIDNTISLPSTSIVNVFTLGGNSSGYTLLGSQDNKYIGYNSKTKLSSNDAASTDKYKWHITFSGNNASIANVDTSTRLIRGYDSNKDFRAYTTSDGSNIQLYKKQTASGPVDPVLTISSSTIAVGYSANISIPDGLSVNFSSDDDGIARVNDGGVVTGVAEGSTTINATWDAVPGTYNAGSESFEVNVVNAAVYEKVTNVNQLVAGNKYILVATESGMAMGAQNGKIRKNVNVTVDDDKVIIVGEAVAVITLGGTTDNWTLLTSDNSKYLALTANSNEIHESDDASAETSKWSITEDFQLKTSAQDDVRYVRYNSGQPRFACYKEGQQQAVLFVKSGYNIAVSITPAKYATFSDATARDFSESGITVYTAKANGETVKLTEVKDGIVPANTGVVLYAESGASKNIPAVATDLTELANNEMVANVTEAVVAKDGGDGKTNYILANESAGVGFYLATVGGAKLHANHAYLSTTATDTGAREFLGFGDGETTAIDGVKAASVENGAVYNLAGQRVAQPTKGLYIVNGKKYIVK